MRAKFKRKFLRAPLRTSALYLMENSAHKGVITNISEGGLLMESLSFAPTINAMPLIFPVLNLPEFSSLGPEILLNLSLDQFERRVIRMRARIVRSFDGLSDIDKIFTNNIGCEFVNSPEKELLIIRGYISRYAKNLIYLLSLFESASQKEDQNRLIRKVAELLGYDNNLKRNHLRLKALHNYQSLEYL